jgi:hypothetical protein
MSRLKQDVLWNWRILGNGEMRSGAWSMVYICLLIVASEW